MRRNDLDSLRHRRDQALELAIFVLERFEALRLIHLEPTKLLLPAIQRLLGHAESAHQTGAFRAGIPLLQRLDDLLIRESALSNQSSSG